MKSLDSFPRVSLGVFPTPIQKLENTSKLLHTNVYVKRDDLTGLGLGGNKTRKLEFLLADAKNRGAEIVFTTGHAQSNHAMLTAAAAGKLGMQAILILKQRGVTACLGNQLLERLMGTDVRFMDRFMVQASFNLKLYLFCPEVVHHANTLFLLLLARRRTHRIFL